MRALVVTNMWPAPDAPARGSFVRDQVEALRRIDGVEVEVEAFPPGGYARGVLDLNRRHREERYDVIHAHFGLTAYVALTLRGAPHAVTLHGTDVRHPRSGRLTKAILPRLDLVATVSESLAAGLGEVRTKRPVTTLPCGVDLTRFTPIDREEARTRLGFDPEEPFLLFPADPARPGKRFDLAQEAANGARLRSLGAVDPSEVPLHVNAANAVVLPTDAEGFGLAVLEALACDVPVVTTPVGIHPEALAGVAGTLCAPYDTAVWRDALAGPISDPDPRIDGRARAELWSSDRMARRVLEAWQELTGAPLHSPPSAPHGAASS